MKGVGVAKLQWVGFAERFSRFLYEQESILIMTGRGKTKTDIFVTLNVIHARGKVLQVGLNSENSTV